MSWYNHDKVYSGKAASALAFGVALAGDTTTNEQVTPCATVTTDQIGLSIASVPTYGYEAAILREGVGKAICAASVGAWARVAPASTNGALGPIIASGLIASNASAGLAPARYSIGIALAAAAAGEYFPVLLDPRQIV